MEKSKHIIQKESDYTTKGSFRLLYKEEKGNEEQKGRRTKTKKTFLTTVYI